MLPHKTPYARVNQNKMLDFIKAYWLENYNAPTVREIQVALKISSTSVVDYNIRKLCDQGLLIADYGIARSFRLPSMKIIFEEDAA